RWTSPGCRWDRRAFLLWRPRTRSGSESEVPWPRPGYSDTCIWRTFRPRPDTALPQPHRPMTPSPHPRLVFLGGVGEVGRNMAALEMDDRILLIDAGLSFPEVEMPGIDLVLPDFEYLRSNRERVHAVVLTHGHEDHVGSLPYLLREFELPIYATKLTLALLEGKLEEHQVRDR